MSDADLPVARFEVNLGEDGGTLKAVKKFLCAWDGVLILGCLLVEGAEVDAEAEKPPSLRTKRIGEPYGDSEGTMNPRARRSVS
jgi:hypothetical protein